MIPFGDPVIRSWHWETSDPTRETYSGTLWGGTLHSNLPTSIGSFKGSFEGSIGFYEGLGFRVTVNPIKLETGLRLNSAGIPYTLLLRIEAIGFPAFWLLLYTL